jgi:hypothetical protein
MEKVMRPLSFQVIRPVRTGIVLVRDPVLMRICPGEPMVC